MSFTVAIIGRPNVGKSTLFNRLVGRRAGAGRRHARASPATAARARAGSAISNFTVIDTAGLEESAPETLSGRMRAQTETAIGQADAVFFVIDARAGPTPADHAFADLRAQIRQAGGARSPTRAKARAAEARRLDGL